MKDDQERIRIVESLKYNSGDQLQTNNRELQDYWVLQEPRDATRDQTIELRKKIERISQLTCLYGLSRETTRVSYYQVFLPAVQYPLMSFHMSKKARDSIQAKATRRFLTGMGYNPNMPR